ncbi:hypothetical protein HID58_002455, partial [Brassica napus]
ELDLVRLGQSSVVFDVVFLSLRMAPRFVDLVSSPFLSLFFNLVAPFIAARFSGGSFFAIFATPGLDSVFFYVISSLKLELLFFGGRLTFSLPLSFVLLRWHERLVCACLVCE